VEVLQGAF